VTDRLTLTRALEGSGMKSDAAERIASEIYDAIHDNVARKADIEAVGRDLAEARAELKADLGAVRGEMREMESRIIIRLGGLQVVLLGLLFAALHYWPPHVGP
jgi:2-phosphoglycerate kinase